MSDLTFWNGEHCSARKVIVAVADAQDVPLYWARRFVGTLRDAVEITYNGETFYLDDEDGRGWAKVTEGHGSPRYGHRSLDVSRVWLRAMPPMSEDH